MTEAELDRFELLWKRRIPVKQIAKELGYTPQTLNETASKNRERFPYRRNKIDDNRLSIWIERILAGRAGVAQTAKKLGISEDTVRIRLRRRRAKDAKA